MYQRTKKMLSFLLVVALLSMQLQKVLPTVVITDATTTETPADTTTEAVAVQSTVSDATTQFPAQSATTEQTSETTESVSSPKKVVKKKNGWVTKKKKKYYYINDKYVTGWKKIKGKTYYFNSKGVLQKNMMVEKNKYVNEKGVLVDKSKIYSYSKKSLQSLKNSLQKETQKYSGTYCIYVKNLDTNEYMTINNKKMKTASVIKLYNMGIVYDQIEKKKLKETSQIRSYLNSMITVSSNDAYNELLKCIGHGDVRTGIRSVTKFSHDHGYKNTNAGGTLSPSYFRTVWLSSSYSTPQDCGHILEDIYRGNLVSESASAKMLSLLKHQQRKGKIPAGLPKGVKSANKTGEYGSRQHDAAIVFSKKADYVIVIMSEGDGAAISHIQHLSRMTYDYFN